MEGAPSPNDSDGLQSFCSNYCITVQEIIRDRCSTAFFLLGFPQILLRNKRIATCADIISERPYQYWNGTMCHDKLFASTLCKNWIKGPLYCLYACSIHWEWFMCWMKTIDWKTKKTGKEWNRKMWMNGPGKRAVVNSSIKLLLPGKRRAIVFPEKS